MKTSRMFTGCGAFALALALATAPAYAWPPQAALHAIRAAQAVAQADDPGSEKSDRQEAADLLDRARQAIRAKNFETAESLLQRVEAMDLSYGLLHVGDTPKKVRRELERASKAKKTSAKRPSQLFAPSEPSTGAARPGAPRDPFARRASSLSETAPDQNPLRETSDADAPPEGPDPIPNFAGRQPFPTTSPFAQSRRLPTQAGSRTSDRPQRQARQSNSQSTTPPADQPLVLQARRALAVGDLRRSEALLSQARQNGSDGDLGGDSIDKVEALVERYRDLSNRDERSKQTESYRREWSDLLMKQAAALVEWRDLDEAERLASDAARLKVTYSPLDKKPGDMLDRIAEARRAEKPSGIIPLPPVNDSANPAAESTADWSVERNESLELVRQARASLADGDARQAEDLAQEAEALGVPDSAYEPQDDRPWLVLLEIQKSRQREVQPASGATPIGTEANTNGERYPDRRAMYNREQDTTRNVPAGNQEQLPPGDDAQSLMLQGEEALRKHDSAAALAFFKQAYAARDQLDPESLERLQEQLQLLTASDSARSAAGERAPMEQAAAAQQVLYRQLSAELSHEERLAQQLQATDPKQARAALEEVRSAIEKSSLEPMARDILLRRVDRDLGELEKYVGSNLPKIELAEQNKAVRDEIAREEQLKVEVDEKLAMMVNEFNELMEDHRFSEAEVVAKRAAEIAPDELVVKQLKNQVKFAGRTFNAREVEEAKENGFVATMDSVLAASKPFDDSGSPMIFGDLKQWEKLTKTRREMERSGRANRSEKEIEIEQRLRTPVSCKFHEAPLAQVIESLGKLAQVNVHLDELGLAEEGVTTDTPVTIDLSQDISLKSALNLILQPLHLSYVIKDEVLKITSEQLRDGEIYPVTYYVADLVSPIPNFQPNGRMGLAGAVHDALGNMPGNWGNGSSGSPLAVVASNDGGGGSAMLDPRLLAQMSAATGSAAGGGGSGQPIGYGPGGLGGAAAADFDSLIELITTTIAPTSWEEVGGPGAIQEFEGNLSLVVSQTQEIHEQIADLLEQLRRLQDLQVTIEVRFITLNDNFFERIGIDFDFDINDNTDRPFQFFGNPAAAADRVFTPTANVGPARNVEDRDLNSANSVTVGLGAPGVFSADLDIPFAQNNFGLAVPQFGGFSPDAGASLGFAILSDLEAFFFMQAAQGDRRSNVLQAPKVTLFNGQQAFVSDTSQSPFVISVIPVVGDFAAAQQPVIVVLNEGTQLTVQAVVSNDRRFVRLTVVPFFSRIGDVDTFTFVGSSTTTEESGSEGPDDETTQRDTRKVTASEGTTVQLPTFSFVTVTTTVSVPDGGTVLLGGIKRLSEGRNEFGVPILNKLPYVKRLFSNVGIGRETQSLMMMVTPRIIIQEEEEAAILGGTVAP